MELFVFWTSSRMIPRSVESSLTRASSTIRCMREFGLSLVGRKSLKLARWWLTIERSRKKASTISRMD